MMNVHRFMLLLKTLAVKSPGYWVFGYGRNPPKQKSIFIKGGAGDAPMIYSSCKGIKFM
jgi:hypothetical protein